jgi:hypothetical protein
MDALAPPVWVAAKSSGEPKSMGPTKVADFDDTCGNLIRLVEG